MTTATPTPPAWTPTRAARAARAHATAWAWQHPRRETAIRAARLWSPTMAAILRLRTSHAEHRNTWRA